MEAANLGLWEGHMPQCPLDPPLSDDDRKMMIDLLDVALTTAAAAASADRVIG